MKSSKKPFKGLSKPPKGSAWVFSKESNTGPSRAYYSHYEDAFRYFILGKWELEPKWPLRKGRKIEHRASGNIYELIRIYSEVGSRVWVVKLLKKGNNKIPIKIPNVLPDITIKRDFIVIPTKAERVLYDNKS